MAVSVIIAPVTGNTNCVKVNLNMVRVINDLYRFPDVLVWNAVMVPVLSECDMVIALNLHFNLGFRNKMAGRQWK